MDRRQNNNFEEEQIEMEGAGVADNEPVDDMRFFLGLIKALRETIMEAGGLFGRKLVDANKCIAILEDIDRNLPVAIQYGLQMYSERERILGNSETEARDRITTAEMRANATMEKARIEAERIVNDATDEANAILADAQERADYMVSEEEILRRAREEARTIKNDAHIEISEERLKANHEMLQILLGLEDSMGAAMESISYRRKELENDVK